MYDRTYLPRLCRLRGDGSCLDEHEQRELEEKRDEIVVHSGEGGGCDVRGVLYCTCEYAVVELTKR